MADYIPRKDAQLAIWSANFTAIIAANAGIWGIPSEEVSDLQNAVALFVALNAKKDSPEKTTVIVAEKEAARKALVAKIRTMTNFRLKNPVITNADRVAMGLQVRNTTLSNVSVPRTRPEIDVNVVDFRRLKVNFRDMGGTSKAKPYGVTGGMINYAVLDAPPADPDALTRTVLATRTPHILEFSEQERGKTVYIVICWVNEKGEQGPCSEIVNAIVP